jgi:dCTP deaminase
MILSDLSLREAVEDGLIVIDPAPRDCDYQPASLEVHIADDVMLPAGCFLLGHTIQYVEVPSQLSCQLTGKSSLARLGLIIHTTAGWIDPGFCGQITLELCNVSDEKITLHTGDPIGQLVFQWLDRPATRPYGSPGLGSHYQGQRGTTPSYLSDPWP